MGIPSLSGSMPTHVEVIKLDFQMLPVVISMISVRKIPLI